MSLFVAGHAPQVPAEPARSDLELLRGAWVCVATMKDGEAVENYVGVRAVIEGDQLTWFFPNPDGTYREQKNKFRIDAHAQPKQFDWWPVDQPDAVDRRIYTVSDTSLRMAANLDGKTRPKSFESARWQFVCRRMAANDKGGEATTAERSGKVVDPDSDCTIVSKDGALKITLPAGQHDFWYGAADPAKRFNAPSVLWEAKGNFAVQVKVSADWNQKPALPDGRCFYAAGLIVFDSPQQYLRLERCYFIHRVTKNGKGDILVFPGTAARPKRGL
jgi:uncharacterized protein (TIGR03067 family)